jgi:hypothetical protein
MRAEYRIAKGGQKTQRTSGGEVVSKQKASEAVIVQPQTTITAFAERGIPKKRLGRRARFPRLVQPQEHLRFIATSAGGPLQLDRCFFGVRIAFGKAFREGGHGGGEVLARFLKALPRRVALLIRFPRLGRCLRQGLRAEAALRQTKVIEDERMLRQIFVDEGLELLNRSVVVLGRAVEQAQGKSVASGVGFLMVAVLAAKA